MTSFLFYEATVSQVNVAMDTVNEFCKASSLSDNLTKSRAMGCRVVPIEIKSTLSAASSIFLEMNLAHYLGFPLVQGRVARATYKDLLDKLYRHLAS